MADQTGDADPSAIAVHQVPDYELPDTLELTEAAQYRALFEETRQKIADLLLERAATTSELAIAFNKPKGTVGHHLKVLEEAGLVRVVRTKKVRALVAKYYGRTARTFLFHTSPYRELATPGTHPAGLVGAAAAEIATLPASLADRGLPMMGTVRYARIPVERAAEWQQRLGELTVEFIREPRAGDITYGLVVGLYPTGRPRLPEVEDAP